MEEERLRNLIIKYYIYLTENSYKSKELMKFMDCDLSELNYIHDNYEELFIKYKHDIFDELDEKLIPVCRDEDLVSKVINYAKEYEIAYEVSIRGIRIINEAYKIPKECRVVNRNLILIADNVTYKVTPKGLSMKIHFKDKNRYVWYETNKIYDKLSDPYFWTHNLLS